MKRYWLLFFVVLEGLLNAQDIDKILQSEIFSHSGSVGVNANYVFGKYSQDPFNYVLTADYTPVFWGVAIPFSMMFSNQKFAYSHPFNSWRIAPSFRRIRAQLGVAQVQFSPYSISGQQLRGGSVSLMPDDRWEVFLFYGYLNNLQPLENGKENPLQRRCYGGKVMYTDKKYSFSGSFFKAEDKGKNEKDIFPQENIVFCFSGQRMISKKIQISGEWANSALTENTQERRIASPLRIVDIAGLCIPYRTTTSVYHAGKINIGFPSLHVGYEYVAPNYQSLGTSYMLNDFQNFSLNGSKRFGNLMFGGRLGIEKNDLKNQKANQTKRVVYSANLAYNGQSRFSAQVYYTSFRSSTQVEQRLTEFEIQDPNTQIDTLIFRQYVQNGELAFGLRLQETKTSQQNIQVLFSLQQTSEKTRFLSTSLNYLWNRKDGKNAGITSYIQQETTFQDRSQILFGVTGFYGGAFAEKRGSWRITVSENAIGEKLQFCLRTAVSYQVRKKHQFRGNFSQRFGKKSVAFLDISYHYTFGK